MQQILSANEDILRILRKARTSDHGYRMIKYCLPLEIDDGFLLFNVLTREMVLLTKDEYENRLESDYLRQHWFVVPENLNEKELVDFVRFVCSTAEKKSKNTTNYTILTTMDCNARCFYCYELGRPRVPMSEETALKVADYIKNNCGGEKVRITWFGGEPLFNAGVIDTICDRLHDNNICFESSMVSNGYLFDKDTVQRAKNHWNLKRIQISLDGTEEVYNRSKAYIYKDGSAYQVVLKNIGLLLDAGIFVNIRLNMDLKNCSNLLELIDELSVRFAGRENLQVYSHLIFDTSLAMYERYTTEELDLLHAAQQNLNNKISSCNFSKKHHAIKKTLRMKYCMADSGNSVVITPVGHIGLCEHHSEDEFIGHVETSERDNAVIESWRERSEEIPECNGCFYYPDCIHLKKCHEKSPCYEQERASLRHSTEKAMLYEYNCWRDHLELDEEEAFCD